MSYVDPTDLVEATKALISASQAWIELGGGGADVHYPTVSEESEGLPAVLVMVPEGQLRAKFLDGVRGLPSGTVSLLFILPSTYSVGEVETFAESFCREVPGLNQGLIVRDIEYGVASAPPPELAAVGQESKLIDVTLTYGLEG